MSKAKDYYNFTFPNKEEYQERYVDKLKRDLEEIGLSVYRLAIETIYHLYYLKRRKKHHLRQKNGYFLSQSLKKMTFKIVRNTYQLFSECSTRTDPS